jgi:hypothetical protein
LIKDNGEFVLVASSGNSSERQNMVEVVLKKDETYVVVPTSTGCKFKSFLKTTPGSGFIRECCLSVQTTVQFDLQVADFDMDTYSAAITLPILAGRAIDAVPEKVVIYALKSGCAGMSYAAKNVSRKIIALNIDFASNGQDVVTHKETLRTSEKIMPGASFFSVQW